MERPRKEESKKQRRTFRSGDGDDDEEDGGVNRVVLERKSTVVDEDGDDGDQKRAKLMDEDLEERDAFVTRMLEREEQKTKKAGQGNLSAAQIQQMATQGTVSADQEDMRYAPAV